MRSGPFGKAAAGRSLLAQFVGCFGARWKLDHPTRNGEVGHRAPPAMRAA
jgi:hypothetical protein